jgi:hypothetical protein
MIFNSEYGYEKPTETIKLKDVPNRMIGVL